MNLRCVNPYLVGDQVIAELIIEQESGEIKNTNNNKNRNRPYKDMGQYQTPADPPQQFASSKCRKFPEIVDRGYEQKWSNNVQEKDNRKYIFSKP